MIATSFSYDSIASSAVILLSLDCNFIGFLTVVFVSSDVTAGVSDEERAGRIARPFTFQTDVQKPNARS